MDAASCFSGNWLYTGGNQTKESYRNAQAAWKEDVVFFASLPLLFEDDHAICVHAGLKPGIPVNRQEPEDLLWIRESFYRHPGMWEKLVIFGHTPTLFINNEASPWFNGKLVGIDTGCAFGGALTAITLSEGQIIHVVQVESSKSRLCAS
jgi:serine/threonine protein phosphatase 1